MTTSRKQEVSMIYRQCKNGEQRVWEYRPVFYCLKAHSYVTARYSQCPIDMFKEKEVKQ